MLCNDVLRVLSITCHVVATLICYEVSLTIWIYIVLYLFIIDEIFYQVKLLMFYNVQTTNVTFAHEI